MADAKFGESQRFFLNNDDDEFRTMFYFLFLTVNLKVDHYAKAILCAKNSFWLNFTSEQWQTAHSLTKITDFSNEEKVKPK
jgi:hypothetical protein